MASQPDAPENPYVIDGVDMRILARRQRWMIWLVVASIFSLSIPTFMGAANVPFLKGPLLWQFVILALLLVRLTVIVGVVLLMRALRTNILLLIIAAILMINSFLNLLILVLENMAATRRLRKAGLKVGFMGVSDEQVVLRLGLGLCRNCGYNLTGNVSGTCPECGTAVPSYFQNVIQQSFAGPT